MISIVIPTFNEGLYIGKLLETITKQTYKDYEVIVVDAASIDSTRKVVNKYKKKIKKLSFLIYKEKGVPKARNYGASKAKGEYILFLDADVLLTKNFLKNIYNEFEERYLDVATCYITPLSKKYIDKILHDVANLALLTGQYLSPRAPGFCIFVTRRLHNRINGFNINCHLAEDHDYVQRGGKLGKFRVLKSSKIPVSVRRLDAEGRKTLVKKYIISEIYKTVKGNEANPPFEYTFGEHGKD